MSRRSIGAAPLLAALFALTVLVPAAAAGEPRVTVVADGLDNPRGLTFGPGGALYVAEAGSGGDLMCVPSPEGGDACFGTSGAITRIKGGHQRRVITGLPSAADATGGFAGGPSDIAFRGDRAYIPINLGGNPAMRSDLPKAVRAVGWLVKANLRSGHWWRFSDIAGFEARHNPDGVEPPDSNPYSVAAGGHGLAVVDAGGNDLIRVDRHGHRRLLAVFPEFANPTPVGPPTVQSVPNAVVRHGGAWYVGTLTGFPFPAGAAKVYKVVPGKAPQVVAEGFTNIIDIAFDKHGCLLVLEFARNGILSGDLSGRLVRVGRDGTQHEIVVPGLVAPGGLAVGRSGAIYVTNNSVFSDIGQVLKISH